MDDIFKETDEAVYDSRDMTNDRYVPCKVSFRNAAALTLRVRKDMQEVFDRPVENDILNRILMKVKNTLKFHEDEIIMLDRVALIIQRRLDAINDMKESREMIDDMGALIKIDGADGADDGDDDRSSYR